VKYAQAVLTQTQDGRWKVFVQSDKSVEKMLIGDLEDVIREIREYARSGWEQRS
jgi:hypothetical protein